ncbi:MAG: TetR/AcrR family transcriptional regulator [Actinomycetota bacterium]|nr:TetR/AcrR family transcriptional regulator [Actinomycetota bacterium]
MVNSAGRVRRRLSVEDRRDELVDVCVRLIGTRAWNSVTMADIAGEAQISKGLLYHYFSAKPDLYLAAVRRAATQLSEATTPDPTLPPWQRLRHALRAHVDWVDEHALAYRAVLQGGLSGDPEVQAIVESSRAEVLDRIARDSGLDEVPPVLRIALRGWVGFLEGACLDWLDTMEIPKDELVRLVAAALQAAMSAAAR